MSDIFKDIKTEEDAAKLAIYIWNIFADNPLPTNPFTIELMKQIERNYDFRKPIEIMKVDGKEGCCNASKI